MEKQFIKYFETVAELHRMGYEEFRVCTAISPNGSAYRCWLTVKLNTWQRCGIFPNLTSGELVLFTPNCKFPWDTTDMTPTQIALKIIADYPEMARLAKGHDEHYASWWRMALEQCRQGHYFYALSEGRNAWRDGSVPLTGTEDTLPYPPPGWAVKQSIY